MEIKFRENLIHEMEKQRISMRALSLKAGLSEAFVKKIINTSTQNPRIDTIIKLAEALNCDVCELAFNISIKENVKNHINKQVFENSVISVDQLIEENKIILSSSQKAQVYMFWYELDLLNVSIDKNEKFNMVMRLIK